MASSGFIRVRNDHHPGSFSSEDKTQRCQQTTAPQWFCLTPACRSTSLNLRPLSPTRPKLRAVLPNAGLHQSWWVSQSPDLTLLLSRNTWFFSARSPCVHLLPKASPGVLPCYKHPSHLGPATPCTHLWSRPHDICCWCCFTGQSSRVDCQLPEVEDHW